MWNWIRDIEDKITPLLQRAFGVQCLHCRKQMAENRLSLCQDCYIELPQVIRAIRLESPYLKGAWCMGSYRSPMGSLIRKGKYASQQGVFIQLAEMLAGAALDLPAFDAVISVPLPEQRMRTRGFNQSALLAQHVASMLDLPHHQILFRVNGAEQAAKSLVDRGVMLTGRFEVRPHFEKGFSPPKILLVDDVFTIGATAESCALELLNLGVQEVWVLALVSGK